MTIKELKTKIDNLVSEGKISEDTQVVGLSDEFAEYYPLDPMESIIVDVEHELEEINHSIDYAKKNKMDHYLDSLLQEKANYEKFGKIAVCIC